MIDPNSEQAWLLRAKQGKIPTHIGIIMDGNGRWAQKRGLPRKEGHRAGVESIRRCLPALLNVGVRFCTLFVFSTENWSRPADEVSFLMGLVTRYAQEDRKELIKNGIKVVPIGRWQELPAPVRRALSSVMKETSSGDKLTLYLAINYGGRQEILDAARSMVRSALEGQVSLEELDQMKPDDFQKYLYEPSAPQLDLVIRTSGEKRISNFLLWQLAYAELVFTDVYWPDFGPIDLYKACVEFAGRKRRFGNVVEREG